MMCDEHSTACIQVPQPLITKLQRLNVENRKFQRVCAHLVVLDNRERDLQVRYERACSDRSRGYRYSFRLQIASLSGVKLMYYRYAERQRDLVNRLAEELRTEYEKVEREMEVDV